MDPEVPIMKHTHQLTGIIEREGHAYVALCPGLDIAGQGEPVEHARQNPIEALELLFEGADAQEAAKRLRTATFVTLLDINVRW